jgi:hypothetical protein
LPDTRVIDITLDGDLFPSLRCLVFRLVGEKEYRKVSLVLSISSFPSLSELQCEHIDLSLSANDIPSLEILRASSMIQNTNDELCDLLPKLRFITFDCQDTSIEIFGFRRVGNFNQYIRSL